ncbi:hypothetical protein [Micromonospora auratinigra]|uniref:hypothetical protein n=1 Tax=Micromonospora auratinigra TaxID=261654 RepID=UPI0012FE70C0|nr:hypothetical protein [Micromonospora auratinigra]
MLDDPDGLSPRARAFLRRVAVREPTPPRLLTDFRTVRDRSGRLVAAPVELIVRREGFADRYGGLRYDLRRSVRVGDERHVVLRRWHFDLLDGIHPERTGWSFGWYGERVSSPVRYLVHTDGRFGVRAGGPFLEVCPSVPHLIEGHALLDELADWVPVRPGAPEPWAATAIGGPELARLVDGLSPVPEASGPADRWWCSEERAVRVFRLWTDARPRPIGVMAWSRDGRR